MRRRLSKTAVASAALLVVLALLLVAVPALDLVRAFGSDSLRSALRTSAARALGASLDWASLELAWLPPRLVLRAPRLVRETREAGTLRLDAETFELQLVPRALLERRFEVDALVIRGAELVLMPRPAAERPEHPARAVSPSTSEEGENAGARAWTSFGEIASQDSSDSETLASLSRLVLDLRRVAIHSGRMILQVRTPLGARAGAPTGALEWRLEELEGMARRHSRADPIELQAGARLIAASMHGEQDDVSEVSGVLELSAKQRADAPIELSVDLDLASRGRVELVGGLTLGGLLDLEAVIEGLDLDLAQPFLPAERLQLSGLATGSGRLAGPLGSPDRLELDVSIESGGLRLADYSVEGPFELQLEVVGPLSGRPRGTLALDLTTARVEYGGRFEKRAGKPAEMVSRFAPDERGELGFESRIQLRDIDAVLQR